MTVNANHHVDPTPSGRFLSRDTCLALLDTAKRLSVGGGETTLEIDSWWRGHVRWARNEVTTCGDVRDNDIRVHRQIRGAQQVSNTNQIDPANLETTIRCAERLLLGMPEEPEERFHTPYIEPFPEPTSVWSDRTFSLTADERAELARSLAEPAQRVGLLSAGYVEVSAHGQAIMNHGGRSLYHPYTLAQCSVTVRDPQGTASGWAGMDHQDWAKIDTAALAAAALDKCVRSRNPVAVEPGRYTTIFEPQAVSDLLTPLISDCFDRERAENWPPSSPFTGTKAGETKIGERVIDERLTLGVDPTDPAMAFIPVSLDGTVTHAVDWIANGVLLELAYSRDPYGIQELGRNTGLPMSRAFRLVPRAGAETTIDEMIATTKRGIFVTRLWNVNRLPGDVISVLCTGYTRDGTWLIENGKISKPIKNLRFMDSPLFALNKVEQMSTPRRVFHPEAPVIVPALKVRDFLFTSLSNAV